MPVLIRARNNCSHSSTTSRRETRLRTDRVTTAAWNRGPNALPATSAGSVARCLAPQSGQRSARALMLDHDRRDLRQLLDLVTEPDHRPRTRSRVAEHMPAPTRRRPVHDHLIHSRGRQQLPTMTLMTRAARPACDPTGPSAAAAASACPDSAAATSSASSSAAPARADQPWSRQLPDLTIHPQQHLDHDLTPRVVDRLRLSPLHTPKFDRAKLCPPDQLNAYTNHVLQDVQAL